MLANDTLWQKPTPAEVQEDTQQFVFNKHNQCGVHTGTDEAATEAHSLLGLQADSNPICEREGESDGGKERAKDNKLKCWFKKNRKMSRWAPRGKRHQALSPSINSFSLPFSLSYHLALAHLLLRALAFTLSPHCLLAFLLPLVFPHYSSFSLPFSLLYSWPHYPLALSFLPSCILSGLGYRSPILLCYSPKCAFSKVH